MTFDQNKTEEFERLFEETKSQIRSFPGVLYLEMLESKQEKYVYFTYSHWKSEEDLEVYRKSDLFKRTWKKTKALFATPAKAWSCERLHHLP